ncbi:hypothetical protein [Gordonia sp. NPDC003429]
MTGRATGATPVRSAPLRRKRKPDRAVPETPATAEPGTVDGDLGTVDGEVGTLDGDPGTVDEDPGTVDGEVGTVDGEVGTVDAGLSYRERRARRQAGAPVTRTARVSRSRALGPILAVTAAVVVIVAATVASVLFAVGTARIDHRNELRAEYSAFARQMTINLTSLNPGNVDKALQTVQDKTSGAAQQRIRQSMAQVVSLIRDQKQTVSSQIISDAVTRSTPDEGSVILVYGWEMQPQDPKQELVVQTFRWRIDITRINGDLKMTDFEWVT